MNYLCHLDGWTEVDSVLEKFPVWLLDHGEVVGGDSERRPSLPLLADQSLGSGSDEVAHIARSVSLASHSSSTSSFRNNASTSYRTE